MATRKVSKARKQPGSRRYGKLAGDKVRRSMEEMKAGTLRSGRSGKKVTSREQAIAIGLSEARQEGGKVPPPPRETTARRAKKTARRSKKTSSKRGAASQGSSARAGGSSMLRQGDSTRSGSRTHASASKASTSRAARRSPH